MPEKWNGLERRNQSMKDHDTLVELLQIVSNQVNNFDKHVTNDEAKFKEIGDKMVEHAKYLYMGIGGIAVLELIGFFHK